MIRDLLDLTFTAKLEDISLLRKTLSQSMRATEIPKKRQSDILLCFSELITNCIEHAKSSNFYIKLRQENESVLLTIIDDGKSNNIVQQNHALSQNASIPPFDTFQENGRGLLTVHHLTDSTQYFDLDRVTSLPLGTEWSNGVRLSWSIDSHQHSMTVLIVEDDPALRYLYTQYLAPHYNVFTACDGSEALKVLSKGNFDLVISDLNMPKMNGLALRNRLANQSDYELMPFIFLSMEEDPATIERAVRMGVDDYLKKPIDKHTMLTTIDRVITRYQKICTQLGDRISQKISAALCPRLPHEIHGWGICLEARNTGYGGGDVVLFHSTGNSTYIVLLDVMGHDETAKFFSYTYAGYIRGLLLGLSGNVSPEKILTMFSDVAFNDELLSQMTLTCCVIELSDHNTARIAVAGHPQPIVLNTEKTAPVDVGGMLPGLMPNQEYTCTNVVLEPGQRLAFYTDGLFESADTPNARKTLENAIITTLFDHQDAPIELALRNTMSVFDHMTKNVPNDDALLVLVERNQN